MSACPVLAIILLSAPVVIQARELPLNDRRPYVYVAEGPMSIEDQRVYAGAPAISTLPVHVEDAQMMMSVVLRGIEALKRQPDDMHRWLLFARNLHSISDRLADLDRFDVVRSQQYVPLRTLMRSVFDKILLPANP